MMIKSYAYELLILNIKITEYISLISIDIIYQVINLKATRRLQYVIE